MCIHSRCRTRFARADGFTLFELVMFIVIVGVGVAGILAVLTTTTRSSADPMLRKQALAIAEAMLEEVELMPFTYCDPDDEYATSAANAAGCKVASNDQDKGGASLTSATPNTETRYSASSPFDNVADYGGFSMTSGTIYDITNTPISGLSGYKLQAITISRVALGTIPSSGAALLITVTVTDPAGNNISVEGIRTRYAPKAVP